MSGETGPAPEEPKLKETTEKRRRVERPRTREEVESSFYDLFGRFEATDDSKLSDEQKWAKKTIRESVSKSLDRESDTVRVDFDSEYTHFREEEGIPVDKLLKWANKELFNKRYTTAERRDLEDKIKTIEENSINYKDVSLQRTNPEQWVARVKHEAYLISQDSRNQHDDLKNWDKAIEEMDSRMELFITPRTSAVIEEPEPEAGKKPEGGEKTPEPADETEAEFIGPPPPPPWAREYSTVIGSRDEEIFNNALLDKNQTVREEMRKGSLWNPRNWTRKIGLRLGEDYFGAKYLTKAIEARYKTLNARAKASFEGSAVDESFEKAEETQTGKEGIQRAKEGKLIEGEKVTEAAGELKKKIVDGLLKPIVDGSITDEKQLQAKIKEFINANKDNAEIKAIFGPEANKYGVWAKYFATDLLEMGAAVRETMETHKKSLGELDSYIKIKFANLSWTAEQGASQAGAIDKLVMKMQGGEKRRWILNPAVLGLGAAVGTAVLARGTSQVAYLVPGVGAAVGGLVAGARRYHDMNVDRVTAQIEDTYSQWPEGKAPRRESLAKRDYDRAHVGELINGGGKDLITGEERESFPALLAKDLSEGQETNRQDVIKRIAEITKRLDFSRKNGLDLVRYEAAGKVQRGRMDLLTAVETAKEKLRTSGMTEEQIRESETKLRGDWEEKFIQDRDEQDRAFAGYRLRNALGSAVFGAGAGLGAGLLVQEGVAGVGRLLGNNIGETGIENFLRGIKEVARTSQAAAVEIPITETVTPAEAIAPSAPPSETVESTLETVIKDEQKPVFGPDGEWTKNSTKIDLREWYSYDQSGSQGNELKLHTLKQGDSLVLDLSSMQEAHQKGLSPNPIDVQNAIRNGETGFYISMGDNQSEGIWVHDSADGKIDGKVALNVNDTQNLIHTASGSITNAELTRMVINQEAFQKLPDGNIATEVNGRQEIFKLNHGGKPGFIEAGRLIDQNGAKGLQTFATIHGTGVASEAVNVPVEIPAETPKLPGDTTPPPGETEKPDKTPGPRQTSPGYPFGTEPPKPTEIPGATPSPEPTTTPSPTRTPEPIIPPGRESEQFKAPPVIPIPFAPRHPLEPIPGKPEEPRAGEPTPVVPPAPESTPIPAEPTPIPPVERPEVVKTPEGSVESLLSTVEYPVPKNHEYYIENPPEEIRLKFTEMKGLELVEPFFVEVSDEGAKTNPKVVPWVHDERIGAVPGKENLRFVKAESLTGGDSGLLALAAVSAETPEKQARLYRALAREIVRVHSINEELLTGWMEKQWKETGDLTKPDSIDVFATFDFQGDRKTLRPEDERLVTFDLSDPAKAKELFEQAWKTRITELRTAIRENKFEPKHYRWVEFLSHSVDVAKLVEIAKTQQPAEAEVRVEAPAAPTAEAPIAETPIASATPRTERTEAEVVAEATPKKSILRRIPGVVKLWRRRATAPTPAATAETPAPEPVVEPVPTETPEVVETEAPPGIPVFDSQGKIIGYRPEAEITEGPEVPPTESVDTTEATIESEVELPPTHPAAEDTGADLETPIEPITQDEITAAAREITEQAAAETAKAPEPISPAEPVEPTVEAELFAPSGDILEDMKRINNMTSEELRLEGEKRTGKFREKVIVDGVEYPILSDLKFLMAQEAAAFAQGKTLEEIAKPEKIEQVIGEPAEDQEARKDLTKLLHGQADTNMRIEQVRARLEQLKKKPEEEKLESRVEITKKEKKVKRKGLFGRKKSGKKEEIEIEAEIPIEKVKKEKKPGIISKKLNEISKRREEGKRLKEKHDLQAETAKAIRSLESKAAIEKLQLSKSFPTHPKMLWQQVVLGNQSEGDSDDLYRGYLMVEPKDIPEAIKILVKIGEKRKKAKKDTDFKWLISRPSDEKDVNEVWKPSSVGDYDGLLPTDPRIAIYGDQMSEIVEILEALSKEKSWKKFENNRRKALGKNPPRRPGTNSLVRGKTEWRTLNYNDERGYSENEARDPDWRERKQGSPTSFR